MPKRNLMIVQGGGPTAVFNVSLAALIRQAQVSSAFASIFGVRFGVQGLVRGKILDLSAVDDSQLALLSHTPGAALGSSRHEPTDLELNALPDLLAAWNIGALIFMGGNGTMRGARIVSELCRDHKLDVAVVGVPKTIDNDLSTTSRCPGFASAARYSAISTRELAADLHSLPQPVSILETLGRNVGWIAASTALARGTPLDDGSHCPHLVYIPEVPFVEEDFLGRLNAVVRTQGWAVVVVAEGIRRPDGDRVYQSTAPGQADPLQRPLIGGVARHLATVVGERLGLRCRSELPGLLGRSSMAHIASRDREDAVAVGRDAIRALEEGRRDVMVSLDPLRADEPSRTSLVSLERASGEERCIPREWLRAGDIPVNETFFDYLRPLVGPLPPHLTQLGVPATQQGQTISDAQSCSKECR